MSIYLDKLACVQVVINARELHSQYTVLPSSGSSPFHHMSFFTKFPTQVPHQESYQLPVSYLVLCCCHFCTLVVVISFHQLPFPAADVYFLFLLYIYLILLLLLLFDSCQIYSDYHLNIGQKVSFSNNDLNRGQFCLLSFRS